MISNKEFQSDLKKFKNAINRGNGQGYYRRLVRKYHLNKHQEGINNSYFKEISNVKNKKSHTPVYRKKKVQMGFAATVAVAVGGTLAIMASQNVKR